jgi:hypothetical protein
MESAKLTLSKKELKLVSDGDWILTKNEIIRETRALYEVAGNGSLAEHQDRIDLGKFVKIGK